MRKPSARPLGVILLALAGASTMAHRAVYESARHGPAHWSEYGLGLLTFVLTSVGILLLVHGAKILPVRQRAEVPVDVLDQVDLQSRLSQPIGPAGRVFDTRAGAAMMQARHVIDLSRRALADYKVAERTLSTRRGRWAAASRR